MRYVYRVRIRVAGTGIQSHQCQAANVTNLGAGIDNVQRNQASFSTYGR